MGHVLEISKQTKIAQMLTAGHSQKAIVREVGCSITAVKRYKKEFENNEDLLLKRLGVNKNEQEIKEMIDSGKSLQEIVKLSNAKPNYIMKKAEQMAEEEAEEDERNPYVKMMLKKYWHWVIPKDARLRVNPKTGMRIVYKGERGNLRTPYRPDRIWR